MYWNNTKYFICFIAFKQKEKRSFLCPKGAMAYKLKAYNNRLMD